METVTVTASESESTTSQSSDIDPNNPAISVVHVTYPNQSVAVQSVIQANQPSVIQAAGGHTIQAIQVAPVGSDGDHIQRVAVLDDEESRKRREILARRPSYRKILNDLSSEVPAPVAITKIEEESNSSAGSPESPDPNDGSGTSGVHNIQHSSGVPVHIAAHGDGNIQGIQTLTMTNSASQVQGSGATIVQYAQSPDGQVFIPVSTLQGGGVQYQFAPTSLPQGVVMATSGGTTIAGTQQVTEEVSRKRELRLLKNREAARECRRKKKEYVKCLENRVAVLENQNKTLIEELKSLKELYCQKEGQS